MSASFLLSVTSSQAQTAENQMQLCQDYSPSKNIKTNSGDYFSQLSQVLKIAKLGRSETEAGNYDKAKQYLDESLERLVSIEVKTHQKPLWCQLIASRYRDFGALEKKFKNYDAAKLNYNKFLELVIDNPSSEDYFYNHAEGYYFLGELSLEQKHWSEAAENYKISIRLCKKRLSSSATRDKLQIWKILADAYEKYGYTAYIQSDPETASFTFENAIKARKGAITAQFSNISNELDLAQTYFNAAKYTTGKDKEYYQSALNIFNRLKKNNDVPEYYNKIIEDINSNISQ